MFHEIHLIFSLAIGLCGFSVVNNDKLCLRREGLFTRKHVYTSSLQFAHVRTKKLYVGTFLMYACSYTSIHTD